MLKRDLHLNSNTSHFNIIISKKAVSFLIALLEGLRATKSFLGGIRRGEWRGIL